jgi:cysteine desulfurase
MGIYLDHAATTPLTPAALAEYTDALRVVGNPSSIHSAGQSARRVLEEGRERVARALGCDPIEVVFTSGGTEAINLALKGLYWQRKRPRILAPLGEHHATVDTLEWLAAHEGAVIDWIPVDEHGKIRLDALEQALGEDVALVTLLWANNEIGTIQPVAEVVAHAAEYGVPVHADAVAACGQIPLDFGRSGLAALSVSAHKIGGPLGIGALVLSRGTTVEPLVHGGGQQRNVRSGTQDAPAAAAFGVAAEQLHDRRQLRDLLIAGVQRAVPDAVLRGHPVDRLPNNAHFTFPGCEGDSLLFLLDAAGIAVSTGSACQAGVPQPSHVLLGVGLTEDEARGALRFTLGHDSTVEDVDALVAVLPSVVDRARRAGLASRVPGAQR